MESFGEPCRDRNEPSQSAIAKMEGRLWTPVYTKPNQEHRLFDFTQNSGIRSYLPLIRKMGLSRGCRKIVQHPMFRGYVFCCVNTEERKHLKLSHHVLNTIFMDESSEKELICELNVIRQFELLSATRAIEVKPELVPGCPVQIINGPFQGIYAVVKRRNNAMKVTVNLDMLGLSISAELDALDLELA